MVNYIDHDKIFDFIEKLPDKTIILNISQGEEVNNWETIKMFAEKLDLIVCLNGLDYLHECQLNGLRFYWGYPITSFFELRSIIALDPVYLLLGAPLTFSLADVAALTKIPIRMVANRTQDLYIPRENGIYGTWVRPEDVPIYEDYVTTLEFYSPYQNLTKEAMLLHVYKDNQEWPGNLNLLFEDLNVNVDNRAIINKLALMRINCGQRCMRPGYQCHYCENAIKFADNVRDLHFELEQKN